MGSEDRQRDSNSADGGADGGVGGNPIDTSLRGGGLEGSPVAAPRRLALVVEYDGSRYAGFQLQSGQPTIQGEIEGGLTKFTGESIRIRGASRTDSGAHAKGQVVDFLTHSPHPVDRFLGALNHYLPDDIEVQAACQAPPSFNSRRDATSRIYRYHILNRPRPSPLRRHTHFWVREPLNVSVMAAAAQRFVGSHDFKWFAAGLPPGKSTVRNVHRWAVWREEDTVIIECEANGFLRHQIRRATALLIEIGKCRRPESEVADALDGNLPGGWECPPVPARGLCLMKVTYPFFSPQAGTADQAQPTAARHGE